MGIFFRKIKKKHVEAFEKSVIELIKEEFPNVELLSKYSNLLGGSLCHEPLSLCLMHSFDSEYWEKNRNKHKTHFRLTGIELAQKPSGHFVEIPLVFSFDTLQYIVVDEPMYFHRNFDLNRIRVNNLRIEELPPLKEEDNEVHKILDISRGKYGDKLELDYSFEIELNGYPYYTIIDLEDGNYVATDKNGVIYRLIHDHEEPVKKISDNIDEFIILYDCNKTELLEKLW